MVYCYAQMSENGLPSFFDAVTQNGHLLILCAAQANIHNELEQIISCAF